MSLPGSPMSAGPRWAPTHVQVTVLQARGLRAKAKGGGGSDAYAVMALGKEKFATSVAERCLGSPVWREEATFELPPPPRRGLSGYEEEGRGAQPAVLQLTVSHRALLGLDKFLGRAEVNLAELQNEGGRRTTRWYKLHSKPGKKEKERGEIEVDIQFMRSNMTASMFDLSMKDKSRTPFGKLKDKLKGKRGNGLPDTASAIIPSITHSLADSDEESNEKEKEKKKSKFKTLFSKPGLQKSNISQSMSVLPSLQPVTERVRLRPSDFQSQWDDDDDDTLTPVSEKPPANRAEDNFLYPPSGRSHKRTGSADSKQLNQIASSSTKKDGHSLFGGLKSKNDPVSRSNVCINGSHVYVEECDPKSDTILKENTPSSTSPSPQTSRRKHLFSSQENLTSIPSKDPEVTGRLALDKGPPESSSLESFKASLPSYKLLSSGDLLESIAPMISDTSKEIKKQENMKSALLSLVTGKKEAENSSEVSVKVKEVKHNERELAGKETTPCEVPVDCRRDQGPDKRKSTNAAIPKASFNPFTENTEEEKSEKSAASVKPSQARPIKPRLGVSSEDETKATSADSVPPTVSLFCLSHPSSNDNNPFTSKHILEWKTEAPSHSASPALKLSAQHGNNPFTPNWGQESKEDDTECFTASPFCRPSAVAGSENNPFASNWRQESQTENSENVTKSPVYLSHPPPNSVHEGSVVTTLDNDSESITSPASSVTFPPTASDQEHNTSADNTADSELYPTVPSETPRSEDQIDPVGTVPRSLSGSPPVRFYDKIGQILKTQRNDKGVQVVTPFKENSGSIKKSVTFAVDDMRDDNRVNSGDEVSDGDLVESGPHGESENTVDPTGGEGTQIHELSVEDCYLSVPDDRRITVVHNSESPLERENEISPSVKEEPPVPIQRVLRMSPKEPDVSDIVLSSTSSFVPPPKPAPRSAQKLKKEPFSVSEAKLENMASSSEIELHTDTSLFSRENPTTVNLAASKLNPESEDELPQSINNDHSDTPTGKQLDILAVEELYLKPAALPVIPEVGSDDEQLSDIQKDDVGLSSPRDGSSQLQSSVERELASDKKTTGERETVSLLVKKAGLDDDFKSNNLSVCPSSVVLENENENIKGSEQKDVNSMKEMGDCPEFSDKSASLSSLSSSSQPYSASSFQSDALSSNKAESPKKSAVEGLDVKVDSSGKKKLLQARVSPSETHSNQTQQSGGTVPAKLRLHPVKPMNTTTNKPPAKTLNVTAKILDNQNETNLKKYDPSDPAYAYAQLTHDELIQLVLKQKDVIAKRDNQVRELEDYIDDLLVRVMEETPNILRVQPSLNKKAGRM
ncbi:rab11 family-interacting protein 1 isoform X1 [Heteronotia binoei]|uniref:rab11 family-interacting protein 1 isoform X1 n=1 Tax=Heteronotia binoei TaxID=13085 RepID=UPI0029303257|nr:rab11 family-interacting protein 1 isoform X1 [Heteronotia binoei]